MSDDEGGGGFDFSASLGGSLMKDLLADLAVTEDDTNDWLNLEQLERELQYLELDKNENTEKYAPALSAAGLVVNSQQAAAAATAVTTHPIHSQLQAQQTQTQTQTTMDAWSLSLQKFTATSVATDFLEADSARKQQQQQQQETPLRSSGFLDHAADYDITLSATVPPPPGITPDASRQVIEQAVTKLAQDLQESSQQTMMLAQELQKELSVIEETASLQSDARISTPPRHVMLKVPKPTPMTPQNSIGVNMKMSSYTVSPTPQPTPITTKPVNQDIRMAEMQPMPMLPPVMATPIRSPGPVWQSPPMPQPQPPQQLIFANPHPAAPPIPATQLQSRYMKARDISYIVHAILRPILTAETEGNMSTYHLQYWTRHHPVKPPTPNRINQTNKEGRLVKEFANRYKISQEWSESNQTLGSTIKTNVARPRALIAFTDKTKTKTTTTSSDQENSPANSMNVSVTQLQQQRATLWKSRIYCDQAYQSLQIVTDILQKAPHTRPNQLHANMIRLFKCLGVTPVEMKDNNNEQEEEIGQRQYVVENPSALELLLYLPKGQILLARVLEQAILPPAVVAVIMPVALTILFHTTTTTNHLNKTSTTTSAMVGKVDDLLSDVRVFAAWTMILHQMPYRWEGATILQSLPQSAMALQTTARMQCTHALLQKGNLLAQQQQQQTHDNNDITTTTTIGNNFVMEWKQKEEEFVKLLAGL